MKQQQFERLHYHKWQFFKTLLDQSTSLYKLQDYDPLNVADKSNINDNTPIVGYEFVTLYRATCQHYSLAKQRHYSPQLVKYLHELVIAGHQQLYGKDGNTLDKIYQFFAYTFPVEFRQHISLFYLSFISFTLPLIIMGIVCYVNSDMIYSVMPSPKVATMEAMYNSSNATFGRESIHESDSDLLMFGHYIRNNIGIDFQIYGSGLFAGIGTLFSLLFNGLVIGGIAGYLTTIGYGENFWAFVAGHGSFELTALVISGMAGLRLAQSIFMPNNYSRIDAFKLAGQQSIILLMGAASMTFIASFIEAFWSSSSMISHPVKYVVGVVLWGLVIAYLLRAGRGRKS